MKPIAEKFEWELEQLSKDEDEEYCAKLILVSNEKRFDIRWRPEDARALAHALIDFADEFEKEYIQ